LDKANWEGTSERVRSFGTFQTLGRLRWGPAEGLKGETDNVAKKVGESRFSKNISCFKAVLGGTRETLAEGDVEDRKKKKKLGGLKELNRLKDKKNPFSQGDGGSGGREGKMITGTGRNRPKQVFIGGG